MKINQAIIREKIISSLGSPVSGRVFVVADGNNTYLTEAYLNEIKYLFGSDINVYEQISDANSSCVAGRGDVILLLPGKHQPTSSPSLSKLGTRMIGISSDGLGADCAVYGYAGEDETLQFTASKISVKGVRFVQETGKDGIRIAESSHLYLNTIENCSFLGGATQIRQNDIYDAPYIKIINTFHYRPTTSGISINGSYSLIKNPTIIAAGASTTDGIKIDDSSITVRLTQVIEKPIINGGGTITTGINLPASAGILVTDGRIGGCTTEISSTSNNYLIENYEPTSGGTLIATT